MSDPKETVKNFSFQLDEFYLDLQKDGNKISILDKEIIEKRPFPGLRPFKTSEFQLFKGRDGQAEELLKRLKKNHFLAVIGSSGTGKSSLVRAGLIPQLFGGYLQDAGNKWNIAICRPGKDPVENLAIALSSIKGHSKDKSHIYDNYDLIGPQLNNSIYGILEVDELINADKPKEQTPNLLIIIDQFEELFRFDRKDLGKRNIENHFVNLLLKASLNPSSSVYVIITMRSEFLGDCVKYRGLPEAINEGQYLVPQLTRNQVKEVIEGPINLAGQKISPGLVELLVNEIEESKLKENLDQLPILQHSLMRTYQQAMNHGPGTEISYEHYKAIGEMEKALANHAEAKYKELGEGNDDSNPSKKQKIAKVIFQALTDASTDQKGGRRPTELKNIYAIAKSINADTREVDEVVNHFRDIDTSFIMPPINPELLNTGLYPDLMMDISHESLMRNWERLNKWISEEVRFGKLYKILNERRELNEMDKSELVRGVLLKELIDWKGNYSNNVTWASRYNQLPKGVHDASLHEDIYKRNLNFLANSEAASEALKEAEQRQLKEEIVRAQKEKARKKLVKVFAAAAIISLCFGLWAFKERANATRSAAIAKKQEKIAEEQKNLALISEKDAREQEQAASISRGEAIKKQDEALSLAEQLKKQTALALVSEKVAREQKAIAEELRKQAEGQSKNLASQLVKGVVQKQPFYATKYLTPSVKDTIVNALFYNLPVNTDPPSLSDHIDVKLLGEVNEAVATRELTEYSVIQGLKTAEGLWNDINTEHKAHDGKNAILQKILLDIFKQNAFPKQQIKSGSYISSLTAMSKDNAHFAMDNLNAVTVGSFEGDSLKIEHRFTNRQADDSVNGYYQKSVILSLAYNDSNQVLSLHDDGKIFIWEKKKREMATLPGINGATLALFSPNGAYLVTAYKEEASLKVWSIADIEGGQILPLLVNNIALNRYIKQVLFAPDGKKMLKLYTTGRVEVWDVVDKKLLPSLETEGYITAANFTPDGKYIATVSSNGDFTIFTLQGHQLNSFSLPAVIGRERDYFFTRINNLSLYSDWKKLLIEQESGEYFVASRLDNESVMDSGQNTKLKAPNSLLLKKLNGTIEGLKEARFLNQGNIVSLSNDGSVQLWNTEEDFKTLTEAFTGIKKFMSTTYYNDMTKQKESTEKSILLFRKLAATNTDSTKKASLKIAELLKKLNDLELANYKPNYYLVVERLKEMVTIRKTLLETDSSYAFVKSTLVGNYNDLAYFKLFTEEYNTVNQDATDLLKLNPAYDIIYTNLALAYLLTNQNNLADDLYKKYKDKTMSNGQSFRTGFLQDFEALTKAGVFPPDDKRVERIKKILDE